MEFNINSVVFSAALVQCILLLAVFIRLRSGIKSNTFLIAFITVITIQVIVKLTGLYSDPANIGPVYYVSFFIPYLYGPLTYFYIKSNFNNTHVFALKDLTHFIPFIFSAIIVLISGYGLIDIFKYVNNDAYNIADTFFQLIQLNCYIFAVKKLLHRNSTDMDENVSASNSGSWLKVFTNSVWLMGTILIICFTLLFYEVELFSFRFSELSFFILILPGMIFWISYNVLVKPDIFIYRKLYPLTGIDTAQVRYQNNRLGENDINKIVSLVNVHMQSNKAFLEPGLSLDSLSAMLNVPRHHISQAINLKLNINFNEFINLHRVEYAKKELLDPEKKHFTIAAIAFGSGFNSISTFNESFKKRTSMTPSDYKKHVFKK